MIVAISPIYGASMGGFSLDLGAGRLWLVFFSAVKLPLLLLATTALCLPVFYVVNAVAGLRDDFPEALQAIFSGQAGLAIALASLAPITAFCYVSGLGYQTALLLNAAMFVLATCAGHVITVRYYRVLVRRRGLHTLMALLWFVLYAFVGIQMAWMLRPFIGDPSSPPAFFRPEPFSNAYIVVGNLLLRSFW
ncbi:MAG TPA: hypothetical protein VJZ71_15590 [Phycisphaerae bacterium]|nr:hypothetical protein [Phycisphaerae bacterium]